MSIPKQDERTPGKSKLVYDKKSRTIVTVRTSDAAAEPSQNCNAYTSTDALRSALRELLVATDPARGRGSDRELDARQQAVNVLCGATISNMEIVRSGSPAPSNDLIETLREIEKQCIQADDPEHHTLSLVKHMAINALKRVGSPAPSTEAGWIVGNGDGTTWRYWTDLGPAWTSDRERATRYARREDAEAVHAGDEDAWVVQPYARTALAGVTASSTGTETS